MTQIERHTRLKCIGDNFDKKLYIESRTPGKWRYVGPIQMGGNNEETFEQLLIDLQTALDIT